MLALVGLGICFVKFVWRSLLYHWQRGLSVVQRHRCSISSLAYRGLSFIMPCSVDQLMYKISWINSLKDAGDFDSCAATLSGKSIFDKEWQVRLLKLKQSTASFARGRFAGIPNFVCDVILGVLFAMLTHYYISFDNLIALFTVWRDQTREFLTELLDWLVGAPAGLKLNQELTNFLGTFFLYHVYIWIGYLLLIEPFYAAIIRIILYSSCFGLSVMLSLASDVLSFLTFHTYCFYVYAAIIYRLQLQGLISLSRLLRGKKWNPLRNRVDSIDFDASQLAFGTILFTILLFLLPTTGIYYLVFTLVRLPILLVKAAIFYIIGILNSVPVYEILQTASASSRPTDGARIRLVYGKQISHRRVESSYSEDSSTTFIAEDVAVSMQFTTESITAILKRRTNFDFKHFLSTVTVFKSLIFGNIINSLYSLH